MFGLCCAVEDQSSVQIVDLRLMTHLSEEGDKHGGSPYSHLSDTSTALRDVSRDFSEAGSDCDADSSSSSLSELVFPEEEAGEDEREPEPGSTFSLTVRRKRSKPIGLETDLVDEATVTVAGITSGVVEAWNAKNPARAIREHDRIIVANGMHSDATGILSMLMSPAPWWRLQVQRPKEVRVAVDRQARASLGLNLRHTPASTTLVVHGIRDGAVKEWNAGHPDEEVLLNDRILEVNGTRGSAQELLIALDACRDSGAPCEMLVLQYGDGMTASCSLTSAVDV